MIDIRLDAIQSCALHRMAKDGIDTTIREGGIVYGFTRDSTRARRLDMRFNGKQVADWAPGTDLSLGSAAIAALPTPRFARGDSYRFVEEGGAVTCFTRADSRTSINIIPPSPILQGRAWEELEAALPVFTAHTKASIREWNRVMRRASKKAFRAIITKNLIMPLSNTDEVLEQIEKGFDISGEVWALFDPSILDIHAPVEADADISIGEVVDVRISYPTLDWRQVTAGVV